MRYIDADAFIKKIFPYDVVDKKDYIINAKAVADAIDNAPTADVVPKSEVEILIYKLECLLCHATEGRLSKHTYDLRTMETVVTDCINETYNDGFGEGYKECAREIFEEIEITLIESSTLPDCARLAYLDKIAELKKKYTEEKI